MKAIRQRLSRSRSRLGIPQALCIACALAAGAAQAQECIPTPSGAVYWLAGERNFDDLAGFHNGQDVGSGVTFAAGEVGDAVHFDGNMQRIYTDTAYAEERAVRTAFTIEFWAQPTASMPSCEESNSGGCALSMPWAVFPEHGANSAPPGEENLAAGIGVAVGTNGVCAGEHSANLLPCLSRLDAPISGWTHVAVVVENRIPRIYLNGVLAHTGIASDREFVFASWTVLGSVGISGYGDYVGELDELTIYDRALGDDEIAGLFAAGSAGKCKPDCAVERTDDLWQGAEVTANTPLESDRADCMFGATDCAPEPTTTLFADGLPDGTVHSVEWQTATPVTLGSLGLYALHESVDAERSFRHVLVQAREIGGDFATIYESNVVVPYGQGTQGRELLRCPRVRPVHAQQFRAEFVQNGEGTSSGPRVAELDGIVHDPIFGNGFE